MITNWHRAIQEVHQIQEAITNTDIHNRLVATKKVGAGTKSDPRVANVNNISAKEFIELIKSTFPEVDDVRIILPKDAGSKSGSFDTFVFILDGKEISAVLAGEVKGRGSKSTVAQEVSWLLVLSAMYNNPENVNPLIEGMKVEMAYTRVYDESGKALTGKVDGLVHGYLERVKKRWLRVTLRSM